MNFFSQETLDAAKELTVSFRNRGLIWHSPDQVKDLCHVCGRSGCSPSQCSPRTAKRNSPQLDKLYSRFKTGPQRGRSNNNTQRSSSRSRFRSRPRNSRSDQAKTGTNYDNTRRTPIRSSPSTAQSKPSGSLNQPIQPIGRPALTPSPAQPAVTITPEEVAALRQQILDLSSTIRSMDERIDWFSAQLESHEYRIAELEQTVFPDTAPDRTYESYDNFQESRPPHHDAQDLYNWDDADKVSMHAHKLPPSQSMIMQISPDTSFSHDGPTNVLSSRHLPFPSSTVLQPRRVPESPQPIDFNKELLDLTSTQQVIHGQVGSILKKLDSLSPSVTTEPPNNTNTSTSSSDGRPSAGW
jgi:hypothetical protein